MASNFTIAYSDLTIWIWSPNDDLAVLVNNYDEGASHFNTLNFDIVLELHFAWARELAKDTLAPHVHNAIFSHCGRSVPSWNLFKTVRTAILAQFVLGHTWVNSYRAELVLIRIVADLAEIICPAGPQLTAPIFIIIVDKEHRVVFATGHLFNDHVLESLH